MYRIAWSASCSGPHWSTSCGGPAARRSSSTRVQVLVVGAVGVPEAEAVAARGRRPLVPGLLLGIVRRVHVGPARRVQVPLADVAEAVAALVQHVRPAPRSVLSSQPNGSDVLLQLLEHAVGVRVLPRHQHRPVGAADRGSCCRSLGGRGSRARTGRASASAPAPRRGSPSRCRASGRGRRTAGWGAQGSCPGLPQTRRLAAARRMPSRPRR